MTTAREYRQHLMDKRFSPLTVNRRLGTVAQFLTWLQVPEAQNPFRRLKRVEIERVAPKALSHNEWNAVRRAAESQIAKDGGFWGTSLSTSQGIALLLVCLSAAFLLQELRNGKEFFS